MGAETWRHASDCNGRRYRKSRPLVTRGACTSASLMLGKGRRAALEHAGQIAAVRSTRYDIPPV